MISFYDTTDFIQKVPGALTLGKFDGIHAGHQKLIRAVCAKEKDGLLPSIFILDVQKGPMLLSREEQKDYLEQAGIRSLIHCPFTPEISGMDPETFVREILAEKLHAKYLAVGTDFRFGHQRAGDVRTLSELSRSYGIETEIFEKETWKELPISSTRIRQALEEADMASVHAMLGRPFSVSGIVTHGRHLGRTLGMPTANLAVPADKLLPPDGVYFSASRFEDHVVPGITNIGKNPTVNGKYRRIETYLYDTDADLYDKKITVYLLRFLRGEIRFSGIHELKNQITRDKELGREYFSGQGVMGWEPDPVYTWTGKSCGRPPA